jgi:hypothetical protein
MANIGEWHHFDPADRSTYPKVNSPIQVRDAIGARFEGDFLKLVSNARQLLKPKIIGWRYIKESDQLAPRQIFSLPKKAATGQASGL